MKIISLLPFVVVVSAVAISPASAPVPEIRRVRYGPHTLKRAVGTAADPKGVKTTIISQSVQKPCEDCTLIAMNGGVQYANGSEASGSAVYLHHAAIINTGPEAKDGTCARPAYDLFFSTGNERSTIIYNNPNATQKAGYYIQKSDKFLLQSEIINNEQDEKEIWIYMNYQYIPGKQPGHQQTKVIWLSTEGTSCSRKVDLASLLGTGEQPKLGAGEMYPVNDKSFTLKSTPWISPWTGNFVALGGHLHDGGVNVAIYQNDRLLCDSKASYAMGNSTGMGGGHSATVARHLASMTGCRSSDAVKAGDKFHIIVNYDFEKYPGMRDKDDKLMPIMAAATLFIGAN